MKRAKVCYIAGFLFVSVVGSLWHFLYEWSGQLWIVGLFCPVNESTWEHMKLIFFPMLIYTGILYLLCQKEQLHPVPGMQAGALTGTFLMPVLFYTWLGILGGHSLIMDIGIFLICAAAGIWTAWYYLWHPMSEKCIRAVTLGTVLLCVCFWVFTYYPPDLGIFQVP